MILLASEHKREIEPLLKQFPFKKQKDVFIFDNLAVYINYGRGGLNLGYRVTELSFKLDVDLGILFGYSGSVVNHRLGSIVSLSRVKLMDKGLNPLNNPIDLNTISDFQRSEGITLVDGQNFNSEYLSLFGDCVDNESYFFAKAFKAQNKPCFVFRLISDQNNRESIENARHGMFDLDVFLSFLNNLIEIDKDTLRREIFLGSGIYNLKIVEGLKKLISKRHLTFSQRQMLYKNITINRSKCEKRPFRLKAVFVENGLIAEKVKKLNKTRVYRTDDYVSIFHNLKDRVALIYAKKRGELLRKTPSNYTPTGESGYSILMSYNCIFDCSYCFLKGYFKSFNPVVFLNYEDYFKAIESIIKIDKRRPLYFYAGTFSDPVALSFAGDFLVELVKFFSGLSEDVFLEVRTKSVQIDQFLRLKPSKNVIFAFSLSPESIVKKYEFYTPSIHERIDAIKKLDNLGFRVGVRFDPVFIDCLKEYEPLIESLKDLKNLQSVEVGFLRFDKNDYKRMLRKNPCIVRGLKFSGGMYRYKKTDLQRAIEFFKERLRGFYLCMEN